jgi:hypothetical protein
MPGHHSVWSNFQATGLARPPGESVRFERRLSEELAKLRVDL